jgi:hypothetical protein
MLSELRRRKFTHYFRLWDIRHRGIMEFEDYLLLTKRIMQIKKIDPGSEVYEQMMAYTRANWIELVQMADFNGDGSISLAEWLDYSEEITQAIQEGSWPRRQEMEQFIGTLFQLLDEDCDQRLTARDWQRFVFICGIDEDARQHFARVDTARKGHITADDLNALFLEFLLSEDYDAPGNYIFGTFLR